jgi:hypothetical protein
VRDNDDLQRDGDDPAHEIAALQAALAHERDALRLERQRAQRWEREAVLRASSVAGALTARVLAAQRLAAAVERNLKTVPGAGAAAAEEVRQALQLFRELNEDRPV